MRNKPRIRFKGFTEDWEQRKLSELATMNARIGWQNLRTSEFLDSGDYLLITGTDFDNGRIKYTTCHYVEKKRFDQDTKIQLSNGSILITKDGTLGKVALVEELPKPATLNAGVFNVRVKDDTLLSYKYLYHYLKAPFLMKYVTANATGGTIKHLNQSILVDFPIPIAEKHEQDKIAKLLDSLESIITLHQRKLEKIKLAKKALLQKLFPKNGSQFPEIRFKGFTDAWEQRKLRNLLEQPITDGPHETPELYNSGIPFISVDAIVDNKIDFTKMRGYISKEYDDICAKKYKPQINDVYLVKSGATIGKVAIVDTYDDFNIWSPLAAMRCGSITNPYFLYILLQTQDLQSQVFNKASHGTQPNLSMRQLEQFTCKVPKIEEQKLISRFLKQLDDVITLHQRKLDRLQEVKIGLLQKMFV